MLPVDPQQAEIDDAVRRVRAGDRDAFRAVISTCETRLRVAVAPMLPDSAAVEDVVQQAFVAAYRKLDQYQTGTGFMSWIATIARYEALNERRRWLNERSFKRRYLDELRIEHAAGESHNELWDSTDQAMLGRLHGCIDALRDRAAEVVRAHYFDLVPNEDIAQRHGRNPAWVRLVLHRARLAIAECLKSRPGIAHAEP
jgi:RNA polymerase sigma-70 factor (ECF subfamily)